MCNPVLGYGVVLCNPALGYGVVLCNPALGYGVVLCNSALGCGVVLCNPAFGYGVVLCNPAFGYGVVLCNPAFGYGVVLCNLELGLGIDWSLVTLETLVYAVQLNAYIGPRDTYTPFMYTLFEHMQFEFCGSNQRTVPCTSLSLDSLPSYPPPPPPPEQGMVQAMVPGTSQG